MLADIVHRRRWRRGHPPKGRRTLSPDRVLVGFADIALDLRTTERQVLKWVTRRRDPLRLRVFNGVARILRSELQVWNARHFARPGLARVFGWNAIARRVEMSRFGAIKAADWADDPLPVHRPRVGRVWAHETGLDDWRRAQELSYGTWRRLRAALREERAEAEMRSEAEPEEASGERERAQSEAQPPFHRRVKRQAKERRAA